MASNRKREDHSISGPTENILIRPFRELAPIPPKLDSPRVNFLATKVSNVPSALFSATAASEHD